MESLGPLSGYEARHCMCRNHGAGLALSEKKGDKILSQALLAECDTLGKVLELDQKLSNIHRAMTQCHACASDPLRTMALLSELDALCALYIAVQEKVASPPHQTGRVDGNGCSELHIGSSTFRIGRFVLDDEERGIVSRMIVKQGLDHLQKKLQAIQVEQTSVNSGNLPQEIEEMKERILSKVWEASAYGCM